MSKNSRRERQVILMKNVIAICAVIFIAIFVGIMISVKSGKEEKTEEINHAEENVETDSIKEEADENIENEEFSEEDVVQNALEITENATVISTGYEVEEKDEYNGKDLEDNGATYAIKINRQENIVTVYSLDEDGYYTVPVKAMCCSVSANGVTPSGLFTTSDKYEWRYLKGGVYGQYAYRIYKGILFHSVPYKAQSNSSLETWEFNKLGTGASLGCIRLCVADAKWIYENCEKGTQVNIFDSDYYGPLGKPQPAYTFSDTENTDWDPTDMTSGNPYAENAAIYGAVSHSIEVGEPFDAMSGILAFSSDMEEVTDSVTVSGTVNNNIAGEYKLTYSFWDNGMEISKEIVITVEDNESPVITKAPEEIHITGYNGDKADLAEFIAEYITAYDGEVEITEATFENVTGGQNTLYINLKNIETISGEYIAECMVYDAAGNNSNVVDIKIVIEE